jgi:hypothetical protein
MDNSLSDLAHIELKYLWCNIHAMDSAIFSNIFFACQSGINLKQFEGLFLELP